MSDQSTFVKACATGNKESVRALLPNMNDTTDLSTVINGIEQIVAHNHAQSLKSVFSTFYSGKTVKTLLLFSVSLGQPNLLAAEFIVDELLPEEYKRHAVAWLFNSGKTKSHQHRKNVALFLLKKTPTNVHGSILWDILTEGDLRLSRTVYAALPLVGVDPSVDQSVDMWSGLMTCLSVINNKGWGQAGQVPRYTQILDLLLTRLEHNQLEQRLNKEIVQQPSLLKNAVVLMDWVQQQRKNILQHAAVEAVSSPKSQMVRKIVRKI